MTELGWTTMTLPSQGSLYVDSEGVSLVPDGTVQIKPMSTRERATLEESGVSGPERVGVLIDRCCKLPKGMKHEDLLASDGLAILLALRALTFGAEYKFKWQCECGAQNKADINLIEELNEDTPERIAEKLLDKGRIEDLNDYECKEPYEIELKDSKTKDGDPIKVGLRMIRRRDETRIAKQMKRAKSNERESVLAYRLGLQIVTMNGETLQGRIKADLIDSLSYKDSLRIDQFISEHETGVDMNIFLECPKCGNEDERNLPMTAEFFRPTDL